MKLRLCNRSVQESTIRLTVRIFRIFQALGRDGLRLLGLVLIFRLRTALRSLGSSRQVRVLFVQKWISRHRGGTELNQVWIIVVTFLHQIQLAVLQVAAEEPVKPRCLLLDRVFSKTQESKDTSSDICVCTRDSA
jgi:hypothetical protein